MGEILGNGDTNFGEIYLRRLFVAYWTHKFKIKQQYNQLTGSGRPSSVDGIIRSLAKGQIPLDLPARSGDPFADSAQNVRIRRQMMIGGHVQHGGLRGDEHVVVVIIVVVIPFDALEIVVVIITVGAGLDSVRSFLLRRLFGSSSRFPATSSLDHWSGGGYGAVRILALGLDVGQFGFEFFHPIPVEIRVTPKVRILNTNFF
jgi:hypothetical protein